MLCTEDTTLVPVLVTALASAPVPDPVRGADSVLAQGIDPVSAPVPATVVVGEEEEEEEDCPQQASVKKWNTKSDSDSAPTS